jgi:ribosome-binding factor A
LTSRRLLKAAEAIREVVSMAILTELRDPRVQGVTVTSVEVAPDMREAALKGLARSAGFLQARIADRIDTRYTPRLQFVLDTGVKKSLEVARILAELERERQAKEATETGDEPPSGESHPIGAMEPEDPPGDQA